MIPESTTRELLISSCYSDASAEQRIIELLPSLDFVALLVKIALDEDDYQGDAPMQAAYFFVPSLSGVYQDA